MGRKLHPVSFVQSVIRCFVQSVPVTTFVQPRSVRYADTRLSKGKPSVIAAIMIQNNFLQYPPVPEFDSAPYWFKSMVAITEKIAGQQVRFGYINGEFFIGNKEGIALTFSLAHSLFTAEIRKLLRSLGSHSIIYGEAYGTKKLDYGVSIPELRVFDISIDGTFLSWADFRRTCHKAGINTAPLLYLGWLSKHKLQELIEGPTLLAKPEEIKSSYKGREGIVIRPVKGPDRAKIISRGFDVLS